MFSVVQADKSEAPLNIGNLLKVLKCSLSVVVSRSKDGDVQRLSLCAHYRGMICLLITGLWGS